MDCPGINGYAIVFVDAEKGRKIAAIGANIAVNPSDLCSMGAHYSLLQKLEVKLDGFVRIKCNEVMSKKFSGWRMCVIGIAQSIIVESLPAI